MSRLTEDTAVYERPRLLQRLRAPAGRDNPYAFGAGGTGGGLGEEAMDLLRPVWAFDYMGAGEYEMGAVGDALARVYDGFADGSYEVWEANVRLPAAPSYELGAKDAARVVIFGPPRHRAAIEADLRRWARWPGTEARDLKVMIGIAWVLRGEDRRDARGWLDLNNGLLVFTDHEMAQRASELFSEAKSGD